MGGDYTAAFPIEAPPCVARPKGDLVVCGRQEAPIDEGSEGGAECVPCVDRGIEAGLAKLDGAHKRYGTRRGAKRKRKVRMLITLSDEGAQITARKTVLADDLCPTVSIALDITPNARGPLRPQFTSH